MTTETTYNTETLRWELGRLGYRVESRAERQGPYPKDERKIWEYFPPRHTHLSGLMTSLGNKEEHSWLAALDHARKDKSLTGAKMTALFRFGELHFYTDGTTVKTHVCEGVDETGGCYDCDDRTYVSATSTDEAINALWEAVCLGRTDA